MPNKEKVLEIRNVIGEYLSDKPKRTIDETIEVDLESLFVAKYITVKIIINIWDSYINNLIDCHRWPEQCRNINKYLFDIDLAEIIGIKSIKKDLLNFYKVISKRIAILYMFDKNLKISNCSGGYLAKSNYEILIDGFQEMFEISFGNYKNSFDIDLSLFKFKEYIEIANENNFNGMNLMIEKKVI